MNFSVHYDVVPAGFTTMKNVTYLASGEYNFALGPNATHEISVNSTMHTVESSNEYALIVYTNYQQDLSAGTALVYFSTDGPVAPSQPGESGIISQIELTLAVVAAIVLTTVVALYLRHKNKLKFSAGLG